MFKIIFYDVSNVLIFDCNFLNTNEVLLLLYNLQYTDVSISRVLKQSFSEELKCNTDQL